MYVRSPRLTVIVLPQHFLLSSSSQKLYWFILLLYFPHLLTSYIDIATLKFLQQVEVDFILSFTRWGSTLLGLASTTKCLSFQASLAFSSSSTASPLPTLMTSMRPGENWSHYEMRCILRYISCNISQDLLIRFIKRYLMWSYEICYEINHYICYEIYFDMKNIIYYDTYDVIYYEIFFRGEICHKEVGNLTMCPECPQFCDFRYQWWWQHKLTNSFPEDDVRLWNVRVLKESCPLYRLAWMFDHSLTPLFAFFMSLWGEKHLILSVNHSTWSKKSL